MPSDNEQRAIEKDFIESWNSMERYYKALKQREMVKPMLNLIAEMRAKAYDRQLRAGQSLATFRLSRARQHGLRPGQANLAIDLTPDGKFTASYLESGETTSIEIDRAEVVPELEELLQRLLHQPID